jgi:hypothetical protein
LIPGQKDCLVWDVEGGANRLCRCRFVQGRFWILSGADGLKVKNPKTVPNEIEVVLKVYLNK